MIPSFELVVSFYPLPKQSLVTVWKWFLFPWPKTLCGKKSFNWHVKSCQRKECCQTYRFWADWDLTSRFKTACFFTNPIFIISLFAKFSHDLWYVSIYLHYIRIYLLMIRYYVSFKSYCFFKASFLLSLLIIVSKTTSACLFFLNKALYVK